MSKSDVASRIQKRKDMEMIEYNHRRNTKQDTFDIENIHKYAIIDEI